MAKPTMVKLLTRGKMIFSKINMNEIIMVLLIMVKFIRVK
jgi:hypothetical protein